MAGSAAISMFALAATAHVQQAGGTADEARAMLAKAVVAVKTDKVKALEMFNKGDSEFLDRDLYVFCNNIGDGAVVAMGNPNVKKLIGMDVRTLKDSTGKPFGQELYSGEQAPEGQVAEVSYRFPRPGSNKTPVQKVALGEKAGGLACGDGYYK